MNVDPIVSEVHDMRRRIMEECGNDIERLIDRLRKSARTAEQQREHKHSGQAPQIPITGARG